MPTTDTDVVVISVVPGEEKEVAQTLLALATNTRHVRTCTDGPGPVLFVVPPYLGKKFQQVMKFAEEPEGELDEEVVPEEPEELRVLAPAPKRRGRPPKVRPPEPVNEPVGNEE